ncbi:ribonuclease G [Porticoccus sp. W117]|uniref:ribonuclease G n=1 Tax=Porticoccus sp. W117 TaxID=3054777 RepID=UPI002593574A|nr:ribonuclease G [Porticoccus sp. W117]MDM3871733.1 ribonuclease G [Porticoccus sp. W117]
MSAEILINITPMETRVALVENGVLQEVAIERTLKRGVVGNIYRGKVVRVMPGMQAAFVDIGLEKAGFIHVDDIHVDAAADGSEQKVEDIRQLLHDGQGVTVQVAKDPLGTKGARLSSKLSVCSKYLVYIPKESHISISQRIEGEAERDRLRAELSTALAEEGDEKILSAEASPDGGYIIRTAAEGLSADELRRDVHFLQRLWRDIVERAPVTKLASNVFEDLPLHLRTLREMTRDGVEKIRVDSRECYEKMCSFAGKYHPDLLPLIEHYPGERPLFYLYSVEDEIQKALQRKVQLKSGGYLVIDQTEAMTTVDVNTGAFVGHRNLEETIFKTNLEAATAIARQLRLRNLGGIIILDFIDMREKEHQRQVSRTLEKALERDRAKTSVLTTSELGLIEMTRKRTSESLEHLLCEPCEQCHGSGSVKSVETLCYEILREILREARAFECEKFLVLACQPVIDRLLDEESANVADLEEFVGRPIQFRVESMYSQEQYDIIPV